MCKETKSAIKISQQKSPEWESFIDEFNKQFEEEIAPILFNFFLKIYKEKRLSNTISKAFLLHKSQRHHQKTTKPNLQTNFPFKYKCRKSSKKKKKTLANRINYIVNVIYTMDKWCILFVHRNFTGIRKSFEVINYLKEGKKEPHNHLK